MQHAVAVERVVGLQRGVQRILGVAQIDTVDVAGNLAFDGHQIVRGPFGRLRPPRPGPVRMVVVLGQRRQELADISTSISGTHHETDGRRGASTDVQRAEGVRALDLVVARRVADLPGGIDEHPDTGRADGWPPPISPPLGLIGSRPPLAMSPLSIACHDWPGG